MERDERMALTIANKKLKQKTNKMLYNEHDKKATTVFGVIHTVHTTNRIY